jgi:hypothetical protein
LGSIGGAGGVTISIFLGGAGATGCGVSFFSGLGGFFAAGFGLAAGFDLAAGLALLTALAGFFLAGIMISFTPKFVIFP